MLYPSLRHHPAPQLATCSQIASQTQASLSDAHPWWRLAPHPNLRLNPTAGAGVSTVGGLGFSAPCGPSRWHSEFAVPLQE